MRISKILSLKNVKQSELDFLDVPIEKDVELFIDPTLIERLDDSWCRRAHEVISDFFSEVNKSLVSGNDTRLREILGGGHEVNLIRLGYSTSKPCGKGNSDESLYFLFMQNGVKKVLQAGIVTRLQDYIIFIPGFDKDRLSDLIANIILEELYKFTLEQCARYGYVSDKAVNLGHFWDIKTHRWQDLRGIPIWHGSSNALLVPKRITCNDMIVSAQRYVFFQALVSIKDKSPNEHPELCGITIDKNGQKKYLPPSKRELYDKLIVERKLTLKQFAREYALQHPESLEQFGAKHITDQEIQKRILSDERLEEKTGVKRKCRTIRQ